MKLTPEQIADNAAAYVAAMNGKPIIGKVNQQGAAWIPIVSEHIKDYLWEEKWLLRPAPITEPLKPWDSPEDVPGPVCWVRYSGQNTHCALVLAIDPKGVWSFDTDMEERLLSWDDCARHEHSTDRKTWKPCVKIV